MRILLLGADGQVGHELRRSLLPVGVVVPCSRSDLDLSKPESLLSAIRREQPAAIVNAAAYTAVDRAETEPAIAHAVNASSVGVLAAAAAELNVPLLHFSTDYVYAGTGTTPWKETDPTAPVNEYGRSKLAGDQLVEASGCRHAILRTSWVYSTRGHNFVRTILRLASERDQLRVVDDQFGAPTPASVLAEVAARLLGEMIRSSDASPGLFHVAPAGCTTWHGFARAVVDRASKNGVALRMGPDDIAPCTTAEYPLPAARPLNSRLDVERLQHHLQMECPDWKTCLNTVVDQLTAQ